MTMPADLPLGLIQDHLNLVFSASDGPSIERFYGDIIGLRRIPNVPLPGGRYMLRYHGGATELKFIVTDQDSTRAASGLTAARGIRSLTFVLPESRRQSVFSRLAVYGLPVPKALPSNTETTRYALQDFEGNHIELAFITDEPTDPDVVRMEFGFGVSDLAASGQFLQEMLGMSLRPKRCRTASIYSRSKHYKSLAGSHLPTCDRRNAERNVGHEPAATGHPGCLRSARVNRLPRRRNPYRAL